MLFENVQNDSLIASIGPLFRRHTNSDWQINVTLTPLQQKKYFSVSQLPVLVRGRILNRTKDVLPVDFFGEIPITNTASWVEARLKTCPINVPQSRGDGMQLCFVFKHKGITHYLPQLELARALFFKNAYLARVALVQQGLRSDFDIIQNDEPSPTVINILPNCTLAKFQLSNSALRRALAWILLDAETRKSFESINRYELIQGYDSAKYRSWDFKFDPPPLTGARLRFRGRYDEITRTIFVYEVLSISNIQHRCPGYIEFNDLRYREMGEYEGNKSAQKAKPASRSTIDDEVVPDTDQSVMPIDTTGVEFDFVNPPQTARTGNAPSGGNAVRIVSECESPSAGDLGRVSTDEASVQGTVSPGDYQELGDDNEDYESFVSKLELFDAVVTHLVARPDCQLIAREIRALPRIIGYSKHLLADGRPRFIARYVVQIVGIHGVLLEPDTSDNRNHLSTLLIKVSSELMSWEQDIEELETLLVRSSLVWPTEFLDKKFDINYKRIAHRKSSSSSINSAEGTAIIKRWADQIYKEIISD